MPAIRLLSNPYGPNAAHKVSGRISHADWQYLETTFPVLIGLHDQLVSTLYHKLINELRRIAADSPTRTLDPAWSIDHDTNKVLAELLENCRFSRPDSARRDSGARDVDRGTGSLHCSPRTNARVSSNPPRKSKGGRRKTGSDAKGDEESRQVSVPANTGPTQPPSVEKALTILDQVGIQATTL